MVELLPMVRPGQDYLQLTIDVGDDEELTRERVEQVLEDALQGLRSGGFLLRSRRQLDARRELDARRDRDYAELVKQCVVEGRVPPPPGAVAQEEVQWIVTGEPGPLPGYFGTDEVPRFPSYRFVWSSTDHRWPGDRAEAEARRFVNGVNRNPAAGGGSPWESGPFLHRRVVTYGPLVEEEC